MKYINLNTSLTQDANNILKSLDNYKDYKLVFKELLDLAIALKSKVTVWITIITMTIYPDSKLEDLIEIYTLNVKLFKLQQEKQIAEIKDSI